VVNPIVHKQHINLPFGDDGYYPPKKNGDIRDGFLMFVIGFTVDESWKDVADRPGCQSTFEVRC
jgi:hypothetical protein